MEIREYVYLKKKKPKSTIPIEITDLVRSGLITNMAPRYWTRNIKYKKFVKIPVLIVICINKIRGGVCEVMLIADKTNDNIALFIYALFIIKNTIL